MPSPMFPARHQDPNPIAAFAQQHFKLLVGVGLGLLFLFAFLSPHAQKPTVWLSTPSIENVTLGDEAQHSSTNITAPSEQPIAQLSTPDSGDLTVGEGAQHNTNNFTAPPEPPIAQLSTLARGNLTDEKTPLPSAHNSTGMENEEVGTINDASGASDTGNGTSPTTEPSEESPSQLGSQSLKQGSDAKADLVSQVGNSNRGSPQDLGEDETYESFPNAETEFAVQERGRVQCLSAIQKRIQDDYRPVFTGRSKFALVDVALHENLGDDILWRGPIKLAADFGQSFDYICVHSQRSWKGVAKAFPVCSVEKTIAAVKNGGVVMFHGGGNWGDLYRFVQKKRLPYISKLAAASKKDNFTVISLPQSIHYVPGSKYLGQDDAFMNALPDKFFTLFLRQQDSFDIAKRHYKKIDIKLSPDIAFALGPMQPIGEPVFDVLIHVRQDKEIQDQDKNLWGKIGAKLKSANVTYRIQDWWYKPHKGEFAPASVGSFSEVRTSEAIRILSQGRVVITNRLHGSIVATLIGKTLIWVDTKQQKVSKTRAVAFSTSESCSGENLHTHQAKSMTEAVDTAIRLLKQEEFIHNR